MGLRDRTRAAWNAFWTQQQGLALSGGAASSDLFDLPLQQRRETATDAVAAARVQESVQQRHADRLSEGMNLGIGLGLDSDDYQYRRLTTGAKQARRDLSPLAQDKMLEICWYLWEQNALARRLITMQTDLILGEGIAVEAVDERIQAEIDATWNHRLNQLKGRIREFHNAFSLNGELVLPVERNPVTGRPIIGFIEPYQIKVIETLPGNVLIPDVLVLKAEPGQQEVRLKIVRENPETGRLEGEVHYRGINKLPNSTRGRSDLMPLADWLDLYDQYMFAEVERLHLLSSFVWDYTVTGGDDAEIKRKAKAFPTPKPGSIFTHNEKETLTAITPDLKAADRSEAGRMLRVHIAGSFGFPLSYVGEIDSNKATIEGQNDIVLKTPASRQKEFGGLIDEIVRFAVEGVITANRALFRDAKPQYRIRMPEIAAKDVSRVGGALAQVVAALDTAMGNATMDRRTAVTVTMALVKHLGVEADPQEIMDAADVEKEERQELADSMLQAELAARGRGPTGKGNPPPATIADDGAAA